MFTSPLLFMSKPTTPVAGLPLRQCLGIDVSKDTLQCQFLSLHPSMDLELKGRRKFDNTASGHRQLLSWAERRLVSGVPFLVVLEATGVYHESVSYFLHSHGHSVSLLLASRAKHYLRAMGYDSKTDPSDAMGLAEMGVRQSLPVWRPMSRRLLELRQLTRQVESLQRQATSLNNQLHAVNHGYYAVKEVVSTLSSLLSSVKKAEKKLVSACLKIVSDDPALSKASGHISSTTGVGEWTAAVLLAETGGFSLVESSQGLCSYAGYDVVENQSGNCSGKSKISKKGNAHIRRALHMPALNVVMRNTGTFGDFYARLLNRGKPKMQCYVAVQRKLLVLCWVLCRDGVDFDPSYGKEGEDTEKDRKPESASCTG